MSNILEYKGYHTRIEYDGESHVLHGKIEGINDLIDFDSEEIGEIEKAFHEAVDDYLEFCKELGVAPDKEYKGVFNVRISPELHRMISFEAFKQDISLNQYVANALKESLQKPKSLSITFMSIGRTDIFPKNETAVKTSDRYLPMQYSWTN